MGASFFHSSANIGLNAKSITVEVDISSGLPRFTIVGLPDAAISESRDRVRAAIKNSGFTFPRTRVTVNLAPADIKKQGPAYDFPIALALLAASGLLLNPNALNDIIIIGELALDGTVRPVDGVLLASLMAREENFKGIIVAPENAEEAGLVNDVPVHPIKSLKELVDYIQAGEALPVYTPKDIKAKERIEIDTMSSIKGQEYTKRALEIAAAGGHNIIFSGPPGSGKTMLARAVPTILPELTFNEALEITKIHSVAGLTNQKRGMDLDRPFRSPHHSSSSVALIGGGTWPRPGEVSLAHRGVLFLDEFPEFPRGAIENLRQPLEDGIVTISRAAGTLEFPAQFMLVAAMNPCPCGFLSDPTKACICTPNKVIQYQQKISGPLMDRIDIAVEVPKVEFEKLTSKEKGETSQEIRKRVQKARDIQIERYKNESIQINTELTSKLLEKYCELNDECHALAKQAVERLNLSARAYTRVLKVARTIADLSGAENLEVSHLTEALQYRPRGRE